jgi:restriction endonuclease Mrr
VPSSQRESEDQIIKSARLHRTVDVPQADRLENVRQLIAAAKEGIEHPAALRELLGVDERHFAYYRRAATILGFLADREDGHLELTDAGRALLGTKERSPEERRQFLAAIISARGLKPLQSFFEGEEISFEEVSHRLAQLTGLAKTTADRRAQTLMRWREYVRAPESAGAGPELPNLTSQLASLIATHNALAKQKYLEWLLKMEPAAFENLVGQLVEALNHRDVVVTGRSGDGGVDVQAVRVDQWGHAAPIAVQVKRYSKSIGRKTVDELLGTIVRERYVAGILVTTSDFSKEAQKAASLAPQIQLVNGAQLVDLLAEHGVAIAYGHYGELVLATSD